MSDFKPLLAYTVEDTSKLVYPLYASIKLDGIRVVILDGVVYSRTMKPIRSKVVQKLFGKPELNGLDGEILYGDWKASNVFNLTTQAVMATDLKEGFDERELRLAVFDHVLYALPYNERQKLVAEMAENNANTLQVQHVLQLVVHNEECLLSFEKDMLEQGYEGVMVRSINGRYKQGRSTAKEGIIGKIKRFSQKEAIVLGFEEKMHNTNEAKTNELGRTQRSQAQEGMVGADTLGALICECDGIRFTCGSGMDDAIRKEVWENKDKYLGKFITFKYFEVGMVSPAPRFPIFLGFRDVEDM